MDGNIMTPVDLETYTRQRYNAVGDFFFPEPEMFNFFYKAQCELASEFRCIRRIYTTQSVSGQRAYDFPENSIAIARATYDGEKMTPNDFVIDDAYTGNDENIATTGRPEFYQQWGQRFYLRPVPDTSSLDIKLYTWDMPSVPTTTGTLDVPAVYHIFLSDYALHAMCLQDKDFGLADRYMQAWQANKEQVKKLEKQRLTADRFVTVKDVDDFYPESRYSR